VVQSFEDGGIIFRGGKISNVSSFSQGGIITGTSMIKGNRSYSTENVQHFAQGGQFTVPRGYEQDDFPMFVKTDEVVKVTPVGQVGQESRLLSKIAGLLTAQIKNGSKDVNIGVDVGGELRGDDLRLLVNRAEKIRERLT
jgi:hypothetical protein